MDKLYFEDFPPGEIVEYGDMPVTAEAIEEFAREFDPQPFHLDSEAARETIAGGQIASGWHTAAMLMRMNCDAFIGRAASQGAPGVEALDWLKPVRPGDRLRVRRTTLSARASRSRPAVGVVEFLFEVVNQSSQIVMTQKGAAFISRRAALKAAP
ncbi:MAG: MaoC family dehydratase [Roseiarcus sp.]|jgi:acyl dehydratase